MASQAEWASQGKEMGRLISKLSIGETKGNVGARAEGEGEKACGEGRERVTDSLRGRVAHLLSPHLQPTTSSWSADVT